MYSSQGADPIIEYRYLNLVLRIRICLDPMQVFYNRKLPLKSHNIGAGKLVFNFRSPNVCLVLKARWG